MNNAVVSITVNPHNTTPRNPVQIRAQLPDGRWLHIRVELREELFNNLIGELFRIHIR